MLGQRYIHTSTLHKIIVFFSRYPVRSRFNIPTKRYVSEMKNEMNAAVVLLVEAKKPLTIQ